MEGMSRKIIASPWQAEKNKKIENKIWGKYSIVNAKNPLSMNESELCFDGEVICFNKFVIINMPNFQITELFSADYISLLKQQPKWEMFDA